MRKSFLKAFWYFAGVAWSGMACAVGFGGINVTSSLGRPLAAEIELVAVEAADKASLNAHLASPEAFKGAGIDYPYALPKLKFTVETRANGDLYIKASSGLPVNEPFVSLLIELSWSSGRLLREYTFLLDPPGFVAEQPVVAEVKPIEPVIVAPVVAAPVVEPVPAPVPETKVEAAPVVEAVVQIASEPAAVSAPEAAAAVPEPVAEVEKPAEPAVPVEKEAAPVKPAEAKKDTEESIKVKRGDTLSKIAAKTKVADVSLERMMVAYYRANADAFDGGNMNRLRTGKILRQPQADALGQLQQAEAVNEVRAQAADWNAYRQQLAKASSPASEQVAKQEVAGKIVTSVQDKAPAAKDSAKEVLKLSKGEAPGDHASAGGKANAKDEESVAKAKALDEAEQRTALLEKNIKDMQRLVELKNQAAAQAASAPAAASAVAPVSAVVAAKPQPKIVVPEPSLVDEILGNPIYLGGGAAVLMGLGGLLVMRKRGGKTAVKKHSGADDVGSATGRIAAPVAPSPDTGDFTNQMAAAVTETVSDEVDPIGEAEMFLNFGRDVQAEEVLKDALSKDPSNNPVKLKLLSIYATRKDSKSFYVYALEIKESGDAAAWAEAAAMGLALEPNNALYGGSSETAIVEDADVAAPAVDFDLGSAAGGAELSAVTFDIQSSIAAEEPVGEKTSIMSASEIMAAQEEPMDFDVTSTHSGIKAADEPALEVATMDFDVTATHTEAKTVAAVEPEIPAMEFEVPGLMDVTPPAAVEKTPELNLDDLVFEMPAVAAPAPAPAPVAPAPAQGMEFSIDIPSDVKPVAPAPAAKDVGLSEISLNLDDLTAPAAAEVKDERWQEVATKLDLAKAYQEMGDQAGAREILDEVVRDGDEKQRATAQELLQQMA